MLIRCIMTENRVGIVPVYAVHLYLFAVEIETGRIDFYFPESRIDKYNLIPAIQIKLIKLWLLSAPELRIVNAKSQRVSAYIALGKYHSVR